MSYSWTAEVLSVRLASSYVRSERLALVSAVDHSDTSELTAALPCVNCNVQSCVTARLSTDRPHIRPHKGQSHRTRSVSIQVRVLQKSDLQTGPAFKLGPRPPRCPAPPRSPPTPPIGANDAAGTPSHAPTPPAARRRPRHAPLTTPGSVLSEFLNAGAWARRARSAHLEKSPPHPLFRGPPARAPPTVHATCTVRQYRV